MSVVDLGRFKLLKTMNIKHMAALVAIEAENSKLKAKIVKLHNEVELLTLSLDRCRDVKKEAD